MQKHAPSVSTAYKVVDIPEELAQRVEALSLPGETLEACIARLMDAHEQEKQGGS